MHHPRSTPTPPPQPQTPSPQAAFRTLNPRKEGMKDFTEVDDSKSEGTLEIIYAKSHGSF